MAEIKEPSKFPTATVLTVVGTVATAAVSYYFSSKSKGVKLPTSFNAFVNLLKSSATKPNIIKYGSISLGLFITFKFLARNKKIEYKYTYKQPTRDEYPGIYRTYI